jgi:hypothetical protein
MSPGMSLQNFDVCWRLNHFFRSKVREMCSRKRLETDPGLKTVDRGLYSQTNIIKLLQDHWRYSTRIVLSTSLLPLHWLTGAWPPPSPAISSPCDWLHVPPQWPKKAHPPLTILTSLTMFTSFEGKEALLVDFKRRKQVWEESWSLFTFQVGIGVLPESTDSVERTTTVWCFVATILNLCEILKVTLKWKKIV